ncbi:MAG: hypothetical protein FWE68_06530, partial [Defluviitaleaceae bacterium]|nr:hypothetical protein [Defluviitaleaceae bacterium]
MSWKLHLRKRIPRSAAIILASLLFLPPVPAYARAGAADIIMTGEREYKAVRLTPPVYNLAARDLSDILILDGGGSPVPYFINNYETLGVIEQNAVHPLVFVNSFVRDGDTFDDFRAETAEGTDMLA